MATLAREILTADGMDVRIFCAGTSYVGISLSGAWNGSVAFAGAQDASFDPVGVFPYPGGTNVLTATANGNWFWPVQNYSTFRAKFTRTSGSATVVLAAAIDSSWQDAFLDVSGRFKNSRASGGTNTLTAAADANRGWRLRSLVVSAAAQVGGGAGSGSSSSAGPAAASWASNPVLQVKDGSTVLFALDLPTVLPFQYDVPLPKSLDQNGCVTGGVVGTPGNALTVQLASGGAGVMTNLNGEFASA